MRTLKFIVDGQILKPDPNCDFTGLIPGSANYIKAEFSFSSDWNGFMKAVEFTSALGISFEPQLRADGKTCIVPVNALARRVFKIRVTGKQGKKKMTTNKVEVVQNGGGA